MTSLGAECTMSSAELIFASRCFRSPFNDEKNSEIFFAHLLNVSRNQLQLDDGKVRSSLLTRRKRDPLALKILAMSVDASVVVTAVAAAVVVPLAHKIAAIITKVHGKAKRMVFVFTKARDARACAKCRVAFQEAGF